MTRAITLEYYACQSSASFVFLWGLTNSGGRKERGLIRGASAHSICFPANEHPSCGFRVELEIAARVKCPIHGDRSRTWGFLYLSSNSSGSWRRRLAHRTNRNSPR
jgi:hypothetical protein